jgi:hypothetical protein
MPSQIFLKLFNVPVAIGVAAAFCIILLVFIFCFPKNIRFGNLGNYFMPVPPFVRI